MIVFIGVESVVNTHQGLSDLNGTLYLIFAEYIQQIK